MKLKSIIYAMSLSVVIGGGVTGCTNDFEEINTDPNKMNVGELQPYGMFEQLFYGMASTQNYYSYYWNDELVQFTACTPMTAQERHRYKITDNQWNSLWSNYANKGANATHMYDLADKIGRASCRERV